MRRGKLALILDASATLGLISLDSGSHLSDSLRIGNRMLVHFLYLRYASRLLY